jgi:hypothetical protein
VVDGKHAFDAVLGDLTATQARSALLIRTCNCSDALKSAVNRRMAACEERSATSRLISGLVLRLDILHRGLAQVMVATDNYHNRPILPGSRQWPYRCLHSLR